MNCGRELRGLPCSLNSKFPTTERFVSEIRAAASAMGQQIEVLYVSTGHEIETAFTTLVQRGAGALHAGPGTFMHSQANEMSRCRPSMGFPRSISGEKPLLPAA